MSPVLTPPPLKPSQLEMNLTPGRNTLKYNLENGVFTVFIEHDSPGGDVPPETAGQRLTLLDEAVAANKGLPMALAITDRYQFANSHRAAEYAGALPPERRNAHLIYLSGRDTGYARMLEMLQLCRNAGLTNVIPVSGDALSSGGKGVYTEDVNVLHKIQQDFAENFYPGAVVNPFKYRADTQFSQLFKLVKKLHNGAKFIVTQAGWDMRKLQSLKWYLAHRGLEYPVVARLILLTPDKLEKIQQNKVPGIAVSPDFENILARELAFSAKQFESAQWRRLELQVAGCRLLGFSGVQISGLDTPDKIRLAGMRLRAALREFTTFEQWVEEYHSYQARAEMAPAPQAFILFNGLLKHQYYDNSVTFAHGTAAISRVSATGKALYQLRKTIFSGVGNVPGCRQILKKLLLNCSGCGRCSLENTEFLCLQKCPKKLLNGPCGNARFNGECELGGHICVFNQLIALAEWHDRLDTLEEDYQPNPAE